MRISEEKMRSLVRESIKHSLKEYIEDYNAIRELHNMGVDLQDSFFNLSYEQLAKVGELLKKAKYNSKHPMGAAVGYYSKLQKLDRK